MSPEGKPAEAGGDMMPEELAYRRLPRAIELLFATLTVLGVTMVLNQMANLQFFAGITILENRYLFLLAAFFLGLVFLAYPASYRILSS